MTDKAQRHNPSPSQDAQPASGGAPPEVLSGRCPKCGQKLKAPIGTVGRCQKCQSKLEFTSAGLRLQGASAGSPVVSPAEVTKPAEGIHGCCPGCRRDVKVLIGAPGPCPHCGARICYNGKEIVALRPTEVPSSSADTQGVFGIQDSDEGALPGRRGIPRAWLIGGTIAALLLLSALSIFFFGGSRQGPPAPDENVIVESDPANGAATVKRDPVEIPEISSGGVFTSPETIPQRTPDPTSPPVRPSRSSGSRGDWVLAVAAGQRVVVDGFELVPTGRFERDWTAVMPRGRIWCVWETGRQRRSPWARGFPKRISSDDRKSFRRESMTSDDSWTAPCRRLESPPSRCWRIFGETTIGRNRSTTRQCGPGRKRFG